MFEAQLLLALSFSIAYCVGVRVQHDHILIIVAAAQIESVASHINEYIRQHENFNKMLAIQNSLSGQTVPGIIAPARMFIHEGKLTKVMHVAACRPYLQQSYLYNYLFFRFAIGKQKYVCYFCFLIFSSMLRPS